MLTVIIDDDDDSEKHGIQLSINQSTKTKQKRAFREDAARYSCFQYRITRQRSVTSVKK